MMKQQQRRRCNPHRDESPKRRLAQVFGMAMEPRGLKSCMKVSSMMDSIKSRKPDNDDEVAAMIFNMSLLEEKSKVVSATSDDSTRTATTASLSLDGEHSCGPGSETNSRRRSPTTRTRRPQRRVRFGQIDFRHYEQDIGDHPCVEGGPALTLAWKVDLSERTSVEHYEQINPSERRRPARILSPKLRHFMLKEVWGIPADELEEGIRQSSLVKRQRFETSRRQEQTSRRRLAELERRLMRKWAAASFRRNRERYIEEEEKLWDRAQEHVGCSLGLI